MGRGLSKNQKLILIHVYKTGSSVKDLAESERTRNYEIEARGYRGYYRTWIKYEGPGVWAGYLPYNTLGYRTVSGAINILGDRRKIQSDVGRASTSRSITRLCKRSLVERRGGLIVLTPEGFELAQKLSDSEDQSKRVNQ